MRSLTRDALSALLNAAVDDILSEADMSGNEPAADAMNLLVNVAMSRFDDPHLTVSDAVVSNYEAETVEGCEETDEQIVNRVLSWIN